MIFRSESVGLRGYPMFRLSHMVLKCRKKSTFSMDTAQITNRWHSCTSLSPVRRSKLGSQPASELLSCAWLGMISWPSLTDDYRCLWLMSQWALSKPWGWGSLWGGVGWISMIMSNRDECCTKSGAILVNHGKTRVDEASMPGFSNKSKDVGWPCLEPSNSFFSFCYGWFTGICIIFSPVWWDILQGFTLLFDDKKQIMKESWLVLMIIPNM